MDELKRNEIKERIRLYESMVDLINQNIRNASGEDRDAWLVKLQKYQSDIRELYDELEKNY